MNTIFFHIDVNSAFLSWSATEKLHNGSTVDLRTIPAIIGGDMEKRHGIVLAKSIPAKAFGIETAEPITDALKKCPSLVVEAPDHQMYRRKSHALMEYLSRISPDIEQVSIDECYMDFTGIAHRYTDPISAASMIKDGVFETFGFTVNVGISDRKVLAKMASDFKKPNLVHTLFQDQIQEKMWPLPVSSLFMCGKSSVEVLHNLEIMTIGDLATADLSIITSHLKSHGKLLWEFANGIDDSKIETVRPDAKGVGNSTTMEQDAKTWEEIQVILLSLSESVSSRLRKGSVAAGSINVEIKYSTFQSVSHQTTLFTPTNSCDKIYETACELGKDLWNGTPVRLLGIRTTKLTPADSPVQLSLFDLPALSANGAQNDTALPKTDNTIKQQKLNAALDQIRNKYGEKSIVRGSLYKPDDP